MYSSLSCEAKFSPEKERLGERARKRFFFEKKKQKTFITLGLGRYIASGWRS
jgi:hypothetical protein